MSFGRGHSFTAVYGHRWWLRLACVAGAICFGILLDIRLSPWLLRFAVGKWNLGREELTGMDDIAAFGAYLSDEKKSSQNTVSSYLRDTTQFAEYLHNRYGKNLRQAEREHVQGYMDWMLGRGKSAASVTRFLASIKSFYSYMVASGEMKSSPAQGVATAKVERKYPEILTAREVELFLEQPGMCGRQGLSGSCHAGAAVCYRHPGQ